MPQWQTFIGYRKDFPSLTYDACRAARESSFPGRGRALSVIALVILLIVPGAVLVLGDEAFGDKWAFGIAFGLWPVFLEAPGWWVRRADASRLSNFHLPTDAPGFDDFGFVALTVVSVAVEIAVFYLVVSHVAGPDTVWRGVLWGVGLAGALDVARSAVAYFLAGTGGYPLYRATPG